MTTFLFGLLGLLGWHVWLVGWLLCDTNTTNNIKTVAIVKKISISRTGT
jgi:hypothetical protein